MRCELGPGVYLDFEEDGFSVAEVAGDVDGKTGSLAGSRAVFYILLERVR